MHVCGIIPIFAIDYDERTTIQALCVDREHVETAETADAQRTE